MKFKNEDQFKYFMKKSSKELGITIPHVYTTYFSRTLLERLAYLNYGAFVTKGSFSQYVHMNKLLRPVTDIDLASETTFDESLLPLFDKINDNDEDIKYTIVNARRTKTNMLKLSVNGTIGKIIMPVKIDFDENNNRIFEVQYKPVVPIFTGDEKFYINTPSFEEHLAEKLCIIAESNKEDVINTRVKDFYDIYEMHGDKYDRDKFSIYFERMIKERKKIDINNLSTLHLNKNFVESHQDTWENISKKYEFLDKNIDLDEAVYYTRAVLSEQLQNIRQNRKVYTKK